VFDFSPLSFFLPFFLFSFFFLSFLFLFSLFFEECSAMIPFPLTIHECEYRMEYNTIPYPKPSSSLN
jgi:hypothetical protein